jgi:hypothetical protein
MRGNGCLWSSDAYQQRLFVQERILNHVWLSHPHDKARNCTPYFTVWFSRLCTWNGTLHTVCLYTILGKQKIMRIHTKTKIRKNIAYLGAFAKFRKSTKLRVVCPSVRPSARNNSAPSGRIFMKFDIWVFFENLSRKFKFHYNRTTITCTLHEDLCTFMMSRWIFLRMGNAWDKICRGN